MVSLVGRSLRQAQCKRNLVPSRKQAAYKLSGTKSSLFSFERISRPLLREDSTCGNRQHHFCVVYKPGRRHEVGPILCPTMENLDLVYQKANISQSPTHSRLAERNSRQAVQARPDHSNGVVSPSRGLPDYMQQVAPGPNRPICHQIQQQVACICVTSTGSPCLSCGCTQSAMGGSGRICLPTRSHIGQSGGEVTGLPMQNNHSDCSGVANMPWFWDLVAMPSQIPLSLPILPNLLTQPFNQIPHRNLTNLNLHAWLLEPQQSRRQWQRELRLLKEDKPDQSMRQSGPFLQWCVTNKMDFRAPPVKSVADFLLYLFQDRKLQPSTFDGYRSAIADKLGNSPINISKDENLTRVLDSFHRGRPKGGGESPPGTSPWFCTS